MSDLTARPARKRRADAERSIAAILDTAVRVLNQQPEASVGEIATAAGLTRPTVYAHYPSREALLHAVLDRITGEHLAAMDAADLNHGPPATALRRYLTIGWQIVERYPLLLHLPTTWQESHADRERHRPIQQRLEQLAERGQETGDFDRRLTPTWLAAITIGLGHTAAAQVATGQMTAAEAETALHHSALRVFLATPNESS